MATKVLVSGGAGYIGSITAHWLADRGWDVHVLDNLSKGYARFVADLPLHRIDLADTNAVRALFDAERFEAVLHFAAFIEVGESVRHPLQYYRNNVAGTLSLLEAMEATGTKSLVFSSTAAVYGEPEATPISESHPLAPINAYGGSKRTVERMLADCAPAWGLRWAALRYFNAAGADPQGRSGEWHDPETHLIPLALRAAVRGQHDPDAPGLTVFGTDYPTPDGTCLRDYVHVLDLAQAHEKALEYLLDGGEGRAFNLGSQQGFSVLEVIRAAERATGLSVPHRMGARRPGDPARLIASSEDARNVLGWNPTCSDLDRILADAWAWHERNGFCGGKE